VIIHYIGETSNFRQRQKEHLSNILGLNYGIWDVADAKNGVSTLVWKGMWRYKGSDAIDATLSEYPELSSKVLEYIRYLDLYFSPADVVSEKRKHDVSS
jgi:hypothetical protein